MSPRLLAIALAVSVGLNLFAAGAATTLLIAKPRVERRLEAQGAGRGPPLAVLARQLPAEERRRVLMTMRASGRAARPDFEEARRLRREAIERASAASYDAAAVAALLEQSRAAERRGRERVEADLTALLTTLPPESRAIVAPALMRSGGRGPRPEQRDRRGPDAGE